MTQVAKSVVYWSHYQCDIGAFYVAATSKGLCFIGSPNEDMQPLKDWAKRRFHTYELREDDQMLESYREELNEYFRGERRTFILPVDMEGTTFQKRVWEALKQIPYGETYTYSQIAEMINKPTAVRAVGAAIGHNPLPIIIPCHRVVGKDGSLTGYRGGLETKKQLLRLEEEHGIYEKS